MTEDARYSSIIRYNQGRECTEFLVWCWICSSVGDCDHLYWPEDSIDGRGKHPVVQVSAGNTKGVLLVGWIAHPFRILMRVKRPGTAGFLEGHGDTVHVSSVLAIGMPILTDIGANPVGIRCAADTQIDLSAAG